MANRHDSSLSSSSGLWTRRISPSRGIAVLQHAASFVGVLVLMGLLMVPEVRAQTLGPEDERFITTWETTTSDLDVTIPTEESAVDYNFVIDWGDGETETITGPDPDPTHTYGSAGTYTVQISASDPEQAFPRLYLDADGRENRFGTPIDYDGDPVNAEQLKKIKQWGAIEWESMARSFTGAANMTCTADDTPDLSGVTSTYRMFRDARSLVGDNCNWNWDTSTVTDMADMFNEAVRFNGDVGEWDVSNVETMFQMFTDARDFNQDIGGWDVSSVTNMGSMFWLAESFNQPIGRWDVSAVTNMRGMFEEAEAFNQPIGQWDVSSVTNMKGVFRGAEKFNQPIGGWDVSKVITMERMFQGAKAFNQPIGEWDVSNVDNMKTMFAGATDFNQPIGNWSTFGVTDMRGMFTGATSFNQPIGSWDVSTVTQTNEMFREATSFNQPIGRWDVSNVVSMQAMFAGATSFDQNISGWDVSNVISFTIFSFFGENVGFFKGSGLSTSNYDALLIGWGGQRVRGALNLNAGTSQYTNAGAAGRQTLINRYDWTINDDGNTEAEAVALTDGSSYSPILPPSTENTPVGRISLTVTDDNADFDSFLYELTVSLSGADQGVDSLKVWASTDDTFEAGSDTKLEAVNTDPSTPVPSTVTFSNTDGPVLSQTETYVFVTADLAASAEGNLRAGLSDSTDVVIAGGNLQTPSSDFPKALNDGDGPIPEAAAVALTGGDPYAPTFPPATDAAPVGRLSLQTNDDLEFDPFVRDLTVDVGGDARGIDAVELWRSDDATFESGDDTKLGRVAADPETPTPATVSFSDLDGPVLSQDETYLFVTVDATDYAEGEIQVRLRDEADIGLSGGRPQSSSSRFPQVLGTGTVQSVELTLSDGGRTLSWTGTSAGNTDRFEVERRTFAGAVAKGKKAAEWTTVRTVEASTEGAQSYTFADDDLAFEVYEADSVGYRVKRVDKDGSTTRSDPVIIDRAVDELELLGTAPNPADQRLKLRYAVPEQTDGTVRIHLYDIMGRRVRTVVRTTKAGRRKKTIDVSRLASGVYFLRLTDGETRKMQKVTVVR